MTKLNRSPIHTSLEGGFLVAAPGKDAGAGSQVIYVCQHTAEGAMGFVLNKPKPSITFPQLLEQLGIVVGDDLIRLPAQASNIQVLDAGPVETTRGFVLHSRDFACEGHTHPIDGNVAYTGSMEILHAMAKANGPSKAILALGYAGWSSGELEKEIRAGVWLFCPADLDLVFDEETNPARKYLRALSLIGIADARLMPTQGCA